MTLRRSDLRGRVGACTRTDTTRAVPSIPASCPRSVLQPIHLRSESLDPAWNPVTDPQDLMDIDRCTSRSVNGTSRTASRSHPGFPVDRDHPLWRSTWRPCQRNRRRLAALGEPASRRRAGFRGSARKGVQPRPSWGGPGAGVGSGRLNSPAPVPTRITPCPAGATGLVPTGTSGVTAWAGRPARDSAGSSAAGGRIQGTGGFMGRRRHAGGKNDEKKAQRRRHSIPLCDDEDERLRAT